MKYIPTESYEKKICELLSLIKNIDFLILGVPGAGKTSVMNFIGSLLDKAVVITDQRFDKERADVNGNMTQNYIKAAKSGYNGREPVDVDASKLSNPEDFIGNYGNDRFRDYEDLLVRFMFENGEFDNKFLDLSSSFYLREENRKLLKNKNITVIHLDTPQRKVEKNLIDDTFKNESRVLEGKPIARATLQAKIDNMILSIPSNLSEAEKSLMKQKIIKDTVTDWSRKMISRKDIFNKADIIVKSRMDDTIEDISINVMKKLIKYNNQKGR